MYLMTEREDVIRIPPEKLGEEFEDTLAALTQQTMEGRVVGDGMVVLTTNVEPVGTGRIVHGDGAVYQNVRYNALVFKIENLEIVEGSVCEVLKFGAFVRFGPLDGLLHISQVMDDHIDIDEGSQRLIGKETKRDVKIEYKVRSRIVSVSMNERSPRDSKIGLTMRQPGLGRLEWLDDARKRKEPGAKKEKAEKKDKPAKEGKK
ncbi:MAG: DNA-directed RNA polymerase [Euryarchaeota archaeon]|nr:DNA-directed RNA polymerase [Euryarchaeota archaeon]